MSEPHDVVPDLLRSRAAEDRDAVALRVGGGRALTHGEWDARSNAVARGLVARGVEPGARVGLVFGNQQWADYAVCYVAVHKAAAVAVPLGSRFAGPELVRVLHHAEVSGIVGPGGSAGFIGSTVVDGDVWTAAASELEAGQQSDAFQVPVAPDDLAEVLYTSGTTGLAKGVACSHLNIMAHDLPADAAAHPGAGAGPVSFLHAFPIGTQAGQEALRVPLRIGGRVAIAMPSFDPEELCVLVARHQVTRLQLVPAMAQMLLASGAYHRHDMSSLRRVVLSSSPAPPALFRRLVEAFPRASVWNAYALTEAGAARTLVQWDESRPSAVGLPVGETEVLVVGDDGEALGAGETGEIWLRRRGTPTRAYFRDPEATAATFSGGWVRTGDLGHLDDDGYLHLADRKKDLIITGGSNVSPVEVENAIYEHPGVVEAAVVGIPHPVLGEDVAAAVVVRGPMSERELQDVVRSRLAEHKVPHRVMFVDTLPRNPSGKVVKAELRELLVREEAPATFVAPRTDTEATLGSIWEAVLALPRVGVDDDFFALGGHSLAAAQIAARIHDALGVNLPVTAVFESPTVAELAEAVDEAVAVTRSGAGG